MNILSKVLTNEDMSKITSEFSRLRDTCYLDNAGTVLYPQSLLQAANEDLLQNLYMNPHTDQYTKDCIEQIRCTILKHFNTDSSTYTVIFTSGSTQALTKVAESFEYSKTQNGGDFVYLVDSHTSVLGLREIAKSKKANVTYLKHDKFLESIEMENILDQTLNGYNDEENALFVYPAQNSFNGFKYPIDCENINNIREGCLNKFIKSKTESSCVWYILLDAASYIATNRLDLSRTQPDFIALSFYKIFGYPTGLGALLVKNSSSHVLNQKVYFGGGTVDVVLSTEDYHRKRSNLYERFEDGTNAFLSIITLKHCFDVLQKLIPKLISDNVMETISHHTFYLAQDLYNNLKELRHKNGTRAVVLYTDTDFSNLSTQGSIVTFNLLREDESFIGYAEFQHFADLFNIKIRTGCFCNTGSCQRHLNITNKEMKSMYEGGHKCGDDIDLINGKPTGAIRVSFGYYNTFDDVDRFLKMIHHCFLKKVFIAPSRTLSLFRSEIEKTNGYLSNKENQKLEKWNGNIAEHVRLSQPLNTAHITLYEICIFPIKSCGSFKINSCWKLGPKGFEYDREWMIVKENGTCLTQKQNTRMCMIRPVIDLDEGVMILNFEGKSSIKVPLEPSTHYSKDISLCHSKVCMDIVSGLDCGDDVANWISEALEISYLRLIKQSNTDTRVQKTKSSLEEKPLLSLSNQAQFLLINRATVRWLKSKIEDESFSEDLESLTDRFRGNLVVEMKEKLAEREWQEVVIGKHKFKVEGQCPRCQMVCIDQKTGEKTVEPLRTIAEQFAGKLHFGIYLTYVGNFDGSKDCYVKINSPVQVTLLSGYNK